jgi:hypothetical protein
MSTVRWVATLAIAGLVLACSSEQRSTDGGPLVASTVVADAGPGTKQVAWVGDRLVVQRLDDRVLVGGIWTSRLFVVDEGGGELEELALEYDGVCQTDGKFAFEAPIRFHDDLLLFQQRCALIKPDGNPSLSDVTYLGLFDLASGEQIRTRGQGKLRAHLNETLDSEVAGIALDPATERAWVAPATRPDSLVLIDLEAGSVLAKPRLSVDQLWGLAATADGTQVVYASRQGEAAPIGSGKANLVVAPFEDLSAYRVLLEGVGGPLCCGWSFDGRWVAFDGTWAGTRGLHVVNVETKEVILIEEGSFHPTASSWSPDDYRIALVDKTDDDHDGRIRVFDLNQLLASR